MALNYYSQWWLFLIYVASGMLISLLFDIFRVIRKTINTSNIFTYIEDTIFWIIVGILLILEILKLNYGELRLYIFVGLIIGSIIYLTTMSKLFIKINVKIFGFFKNIALIFYKFIKNIMLKLYNIIKNIILMIIKPIDIILTKTSNKARKISLKKLSFKKATSKRRENKT